MSRKKDEMKGPIYYTTFQAAKLLGVSPPTVVNWVNLGVLAAHRTPGGHRRIGQDDLVVFATEYHYPLPESLKEGAQMVRRVLIVDDERDFGVTVREYLVVRGGFEVEVAESGFAAGLTIARFQPHVVLMDIMMPDMDGFEVLRMLRADPATRHIPVIACTAYRDPLIESRIAEEAFDGFVQKPLKLDALVELLTSVAPLPENGDTKV
jgi:excisionase family DNA binding protein